MAAIRAKKVKKARVVGLHGPAVGSGKGIECKDCHRVFATKERFDEHFGQMPPGHGLSYQ